ncbi:hypothetical protein PRIPAC_86431 [Pristionchus pacificus]|uniref:CUB domain-containing protein n=1 Tax=Pristionchus pacificus TaxID=54126 RepID=A0A2A6BS81_PRIPA|nr:hypothetical protein PRIPAC_86431 [Pristionchus pacificus]|eukprot:PDM68653.1 CUB domain-containing protein [Pristionchus pacificus]
MSKMPEQSLKSWSDAQMICKKLGANLASIHNERIGQNGDKGTRRWRLTQVSPPPPPNHWPRRGHCVAMHTSSASSGQWMNLDCTAKLPVVCIRMLHQNYNTQETLLFLYIRELPFFLCFYAPVVKPKCSSDPPTEGDINTSPGFPYTASTPCDYFLIVDAGMKVELEIILLEANSCCDSLTLFDGYLRGDVIAKLSGALQNVTQTTATSNVMRVSWQPNGGVNVRGVAMQFRGV